MWAILLTASFVLVLLFLIRDTRKPQGFPPGPQWVPVFGNYFLYYRLYVKIGFTHLVWQWLSKKYGPLVGVRLGNDRLVIATGHTVVKEILSRDEFDARPNGFFFKFRAFGQRFGLVFVDGEFFNEQKKFCMKHLKSLGLNRSIMEDRINVETGELVQALLKNSEKTVQIPEALEVSVLNSLWTMMAGERFRLDDPRARQLLSHIHTSFRLQDMSGGILNQLPFLRFLLPQVHSSYTKLRHILQTLITFIQELVDAHRSSLSPYENRDLIDAFINEMNKHEGGVTTFTEKQLIILVLDLFLAGAETTSSTLGFAILYLIHNPEIQAKLHQEMDTVVGKNKQPFLQHRHSRHNVALDGLIIMAKELSYLCRSTTSHSSLSQQPICNSLIYFEAFIMEIQRIANVSPTTVSHRAKEDAEVQGYRIPKDTIVLCNLYSLNMNRDHWGDPENFRPERFINNKGQLIQDDWLIPFGLGKRRCMGEALARTSIYLFLTAILQNFEVSGKPGVPLPPIRAQDGATLVPASFQAVFTRRH